MAGTTVLRLCYLVILVGFSSVSWAQSVDGLLANKLNANPVQLEQMLADALSRRLDFVDFSYVSPRQQDLRGGWRADYNWNYSRRNGQGFTVVDKKASVRNLAFDVSIDGSYAYGNADNTDNYSKASLAFAMERGDFGTISYIKKADSTAYQECLNGLDISSPDYAEASARCEIESGVEKFITKRGNTRFMTAGIHFAYEGNQDFSARNKDYGLSLYYSRGAWPSIGLLLDRVDPSDNPARVALAGKDQYDRAALKLAYRGDLGDFVGYPMWFYLSWQHFQEISAPAAIKAANMDTFDYVSMSIRFPASALSDVFAGGKTMLFVRYTTGKLPFDIKTGSAIELGISSNLAALASLIAH